METEYRIEKFYPFPISEEQLNKMSAMGWDLVTCVTIKEHGLINNTIVYYFKKELNQAPTGENNELSSFLHKSLLEATRTLNDKFQEGLDKEIK